MSSPEEVVPCLDRPVGDVLVGEVIFSTSRNRLMTPVFSLSSCLLGSQRSPSDALVAVLTARKSFGIDGFVGASVFGCADSGLGSGVSPVLCLTYVCIIGSESHLYSHISFRNDDNR